MPTSAPTAHTEDWSSIKQLCLWPEQRRYELQRPCVLFGDPATQRSGETQTPERTLQRSIAQFTAQGMISLFRPTQQQVKDHHRSLPPPMRQCIVDCKAEHPGLSLHEIASICFVRFARRPSPHTIQQVLADGPPPTMSGRRYPHYHEMTDVAMRRTVVIGLHAEGWTPTSIAQYLDVHRSTIYDILKRFAAEGEEGLTPRSSANTRPVRTVDLAMKHEVRQLQENPELGAFRIWAALRRQGIHVSRATVGRIMAENRRLYGLDKPPKEPKEPKEHPFKGQYRHHIWSVDVRYIEHHQIPGIKGPIYIISILENLSRAILASDVVQRQNLTSYLLVLFAAIRQHGSPAMLVSDSGKIFKAKQAQQVYDAFGIEKKQIDKRQSWQNLIESQLYVSWNTLAW